MKYQKTLRNPALSLAALFLLLGPLSAAAQTDLPVGTSSLMVPAAAFASDGTATDQVINYGYYASTNSTVHLRAALYFPNTAVITNIDMMTLDDDVGTITGYLKRNVFGRDGATETIFTFTSPGSIGCTTDGLCHDMEFNTDIKIDAANYNYWFEVIVPDDTGTGTDLDFYAVRFLYDSDDVIFADTFESSDTSMWVGSAAKSGETSPELADLMDPSEHEKRLLDSVSRLYIEDPLAQEAFEAAVKGTKGYGSPLIIPGPAFKTAGGSDYESYYFSESYGFVYGRGNDDSTLMYAPVDLPNGSEIQYFMAFFVDSVSDHGLAGYQDNIHFWLKRASTVDISPTLSMAYEVSSGAQDDIRSLTASHADMEAVESGCTTIDTAAHYYWAAIDVGRYDTSPPSPYGAEDWWHKVYAIAILYTQP